MFLPRIVAQTGKNCTATAVLLHGSGETGDGLYSTFRTLLQEELSFPHIRVIYPTAPLRPYSLAGGLNSTVWFDHLTLEPEGKEPIKSVDTMAAQLGQLIDEEIKNGISPQRIVLGGFSMGGAMALHLGYRFYPHVAGVLAMSSFLNDNSIVYKHLETSDQSAHIPPLQQYHGENDDLVLHEWGKATHNKLTSLGVKGEFVSFPNLTHVMDARMAQSAIEWIAKILPEDHSS